MLSRSSTIAYGLAALAGTLYFLGFAGFGIWPLSLIALVPLFAILDLGPWTWGQRLRIGLWFGLITNLGGYYWLVATLEAFSGFAFVPSLLFTLVVCTYQGGLLAVFFALCAHGRQRGVPVTWMAIPALVALEWLYPLLFPSYYGNAFHGLPHLIQIADLGGPSLVSALAVLVNGAVYEVGRALWRKRPLPRWEPCLAGAAVIASLAYGSWRIHALETRMAEAPKLDVGLVQVNMDVFSKHDEPQKGHRRHLEQSRALERSNAIDLLIWPETALSFVVPEGIDNVKRHVMDDLRTPVLFGGLARRTIDGRPRIYNTAFLADATGRLRGSYDKTYLLPFAEYLPFGELLPRLYEWSPHSGRFSRGNHVEPLRLGDHRIGTLICYEDILPAFVRSLVRRGSPHLLVNLTNDAWFGDTHAPWVHLALSKFRAVEHHRYLLRATNSGVSAIIDPAGRVVQQSETYARTTLHGPVALLSAPTMYERWGDWPGWLGLLGSFSLTLAYRRPRYHAT